MQITRYDSNAVDLFGAGAFIGAVLAYSGIKNSLIIFHGVAGCNIEAIHFRSDQIPAGHYVPVIPTGITESDCIQGGIDKLYKTLRDVIGQSIKRNKKLDVVFVVTSDATSIIGDDIETASRVVSAETSVPIIPIDTPGFAGKVNFGTDRALSSLLRTFTSEKSESIQEGLNIIAPFNMGSKNWNNDHDEMVRMLEASGIKVQTNLCRNTTVDDISKYSAARFNYNPSYESLSEFTQLSTVQNIDKILPLPLGIANTEEWLIGMAKIFGVSDKAKHFLQEEKRTVTSQLRYNYNFSWMSTLMHGKYCSILAPAVFGASLARCLYWDFGIIPKVVALYTESQKAIDAALELLDPLKNAEINVLLNPSYYDYSKVITESKVDFAIGSIHDKPLCLGNKIPHLSLAGYNFYNQYNFIPYPNMGIKGVLCLLTELSKVMEDTFYLKDSISHLNYKERAENESSCSERV